MSSLNWGIEQRYETIAMYDFEGKGKQDAYDKRVNSQHDDSRYQQRVHQYLERRTDPDTITGSQLARNRRTRGYVVRPVGDVHRYAIQGGGVHDTAHVCATAGGSNAHDLLFMRRCQFVSM